MKQRLRNIYRMGIKELFSLRYDPVMMFLIIYSFTISVYMVASGASMGVNNAAVAIVDEDDSQLSQKFFDALLPPYFQRPDRLSVHEIDEAMDSGRYTFVIDIPPSFQAELLAGRRPVIQLNVDATDMSMAGVGSGYIERIINRAVTTFLKEKAAAPPVRIVIRAMFNPNMDTSWFQSIMEVANEITILAIILAGAAIIREREHGTIEHLLVMPLRAADIMIAKVWANGLVIVIAATLSLYLVVQHALAVTIIGSIPLFVAGTVVYLFSVTALGIFLATLARSMPQFGLLALIVFVIMILLSGGNTPLDSMPEPLQIIMQIVPSTHFINISQAVLFRGAGLDVVWPDFVAVIVIGAVFFLAALARFRKTVTVLTT